MSNVSSGSGVAVPQARGLSRPTLGRWDTGAIPIWLLVSALVLYLGLHGGGYDLVIRSQATVVVWWVVLFAALLGVMPNRPIGRRAWVALGLFTAFVAWSALATRWSLSRELSLQEVSRVTGYLGVLVLAVLTYGDRRRALCHVVGAVATTATALVALAVLSRIRPGLFPAAATTAGFLPGTHARLDWPLNYWNALGALDAFTLPLLLALATSARRLGAQAAAAAAIPLTVLCAYLTFSRGGAIAGAAAVLAFVLLAPDRVPKLATVALCAAGSAALIAGAVHRPALAQGLTGPAASGQGDQLLIAVGFVCAAVALGQVAIGLAARHGDVPRVLRVSPVRAARLTAAVSVLAVIAALAGGAPHRLSHAWHQFQQPNSAVLNQDQLSRFGSLSGNDRYAYWKTAIDAMPGHLVGGYGPGTFQLVWLPRAPYFSYVRNAHSLYVETLSDVGVVGLTLLVAFLVFMVGCALDRVVRGRPDQRAFAAAVSAACVAFIISSAFDWVWQVPVLPIGMLLLAAAVLPPLGRRGPAPVWRRRAQRLVLALAGVAALVAIGVPLAAMTAVRRSQAAASVGSLPAALADATTATRIEPDAASPRVQAALVLEMQGHRSAALAEQRAAVSREPQNWQLWFVLSRLSAEAGDARGALTAYRRARELNPRSPLFRQ